MKTWIIITLTVLVLLALAIIGCSSTKDSNIIRVIKIAPEDTQSIMYMDFDVIKNDPDCAPMYDDMRDSIESEMEGVQVTDIIGYGMINVEHGGLDVRIGEYNTEDMRNTLKEQGGKEEEYQGIEIWVSDTHGLPRAFTFIDNMVVFGDKDTVEASICAYKNIEPSLYDNEDVKTILNEIPGGIFHIIINPIPNELLNIFGTGTGFISICNLVEGDEVLDIKGLFKFESEADAENYLEKTKELARGFLFSTPMDIEAKLKGRFIEITGDMDLEDFD
jgi:hypothetical protein